MPSSRRRSGDLGSYQRCSAGPPQWTLANNGSPTRNRRPRRDNWRLSTNLYLADSMEEAVEDISAGMLTEAREYGFYLFGKAGYEAYPGQPAEEMTAQQIIDQRQWIVGDPDYCIRRIKELEETSGGG